MVRGQKSAVGDIDGRGLYDKVSNMTLATRSPVREFPKAKAAARKGQMVEIVGRKSGERFLLTAKKFPYFRRTRSVRQGYLQGGA